MSSFKNNTLLPRLADISPNPSTHSSTGSTYGNDYRRPSQIESYGTHCQEPTCNLSDFLPFKCDYCNKSYCSSHRIPNSTHDCPSFDASKNDIKVDLCQWCNEPLKVEHLKYGRESDINVIMEDHIQSGQCKVLKNVGKDGLFFTKDRNGNAVYMDNNNNNNKKKKNEKTCNYARCKNIMWVEMKCPQCRISFCPTHRETRSHKCGEMQEGNTATGVKAGITSGRSPTLPAKSSRKTSPLVPQNPFSKLSLTSSKNSNTSPIAPPTTKTSTTASSNTNSNTGKTSIAIPNVVDVIKSKTTSNVNDMSTSRRAAREREQAALALKNRAKKGLLSEDEKVRYATLQALEAKQGSKSTQSKDNTDCCIS